MISRVREPPPPYLLDSFFVLCEEVGRWLTLRSRQTDLTSSTSVTVVHRSAKGTRGGDRVRWAPRVHEKVRIFFHGV